jgi:tetratricopeptide (TPR) repeat protein
MSGRTDEAISAYRKAMDLDLQHAFADDLGHAKLAVVYAANRKYELAEAALHAFDRSASGNSRLLLPLIEGRLAEERGQMQAAEQHYQRAVVLSLENKSERFLDYSLLALGAVSLFAGNPGAALSFAHGRNIASKDSLSLCLLHANAGDYSGAEACVAEAAPAPRIRESYRIRFEMLRAYARQNADAVLSTAAKAREHEVDSWLLFYRGRALLCKKEYGIAIDLFTRAIQDERRHPLVARFRSPVLRLLCYFYVSQAQEAAGKRNKAIAGYREFLSHFGPASTALPQVAAARTALKRLGVG